MVKSLVLLLSLFFISSNSIDKRKLVGKWQLNAFYILEKNKEKQEVDLEKYSDCEKRSYLEINDSIFKSVSYSTFYARKVWCFKDTKQYKYNLVYDFNKNTYNIEDSFNFKSIKYSIVVLNDSILQLEDQNSLKEYRKVKKLNPR